jgi:hypothetical protein
MTRLSGRGAQAHRCRNSRLEDTQVPEAVHDLAGKVQDGGVVVLWPGVT